MRYIRFIIIPILINGFLVLLRRPKEAKEGKVYLPKFLAVVGLITSTFFLVLSFISAYSGKAYGASVGFFCFSLLGAAFVIAFVNCRISYDQDGFVAKNFFGIKRKYTYDQVTAIEEKWGDEYVYMGKRRVLVAELSVGGNNFINLVKKKYRAIHNGEFIPKIQNKKRDIFNGNVKDAPAFIIAYAIFGVAILALSAFLVWDFYLTPRTLDDTVEQQVIFETWEAYDKDIVLTSYDGRIYKINNADESFGAERLNVICDGKTVVTTYADEYTTDDGVVYYSLAAILNGDTYILSVDEINSMHRQAVFPVMLIAIAMVIVWAALFMATIVVGRDPKKYGKKIVGLFFQKGYVKFD